MLRVKVFVRGQKTKKKFVLTRICLFVDLEKKRVSLSTSAGDWFGQLVGSDWCWLKQ